MHFGLASLLQNPMMTAVIWLVVVALALCMGGIWMLYLMKVVMNDDDIQDKIRRHKRINEEIIRAQQSNNRAA